MRSQASLFHEKPPLNLDAAEIDEEAEALEGYVVDPSHYADNAARLKTSADGRYVLIPQPLDTPSDPLNWSDGKKWLIVAIIAYIALLADYTGGTAIITIIPQSMQWQLAQATVQRAVVGNLFTIGACGLFVVPFASYFGRWPVTLVFQCVMLGTCAWSAAATSFRSYLAARIINGFFCSVGQGGALMWIKDLFFFHQHPQIINYVEFSIILSPYLGPLITCFIVSDVSWRWAFWVCTILSGVGLVLVFLLDESLFDRKSPPSSPGTYVSRLIGVHQTRTSQRSFTQCMARPIVAITKIPVLTILIYYFLNSAWVIGVNTTIGIWLTNIYGFSSRGIGYFYFFGIVGVLLGWFIGHFLHDAVGWYYMKRHSGRLDPEARLIITYPATILCCVSLIILGFAFERHWHYMVIAVFAAMQCVGVMIVTTAINAYLLDCYPEGSGEVGAWVTASRNWAGFMATYVQIDWVTRIGPAKALGIQAAITFASLFFMAFLQAYGKQMRKWQGRMVFGNQKRA
ncbi:MFS transporter [Penicillium argentinense]|uniref:MFS transporter n=1 Tax=Penicillium argentinense TaxID=1131581 RepID=A0A9W9EXB2_9EURO|nr:MFS transporter [Penicillium argentinense]KAJ5089738.1 MFS transporter [Penicillium argentinense]